MAFCASGWSNGRDDETRWVSSSLPPSASALPVPAASIPPEFLRRISLRRSCETIRFAFDAADLFAAAPPLFYFFPQLLFSPLLPVSAILLARIFPPPPFAFSVFLPPLSFAARANALLQLSSAVP